MSYPLLLLIISLVVIVPSVFVVRNKSKQNLLTNNNKNQKALTNRSNTQGNNPKVSAEQLQIAETIQKYRNHPALPISFRQLLGKIHAQYVTLNSVKLSPEQRFTVDKLAGTRLAEILEDYLTLDSDYAQNTIIDTEHDSTSADVTYAQLVSILDFMGRTQEEGQAQVASNILANRNYLQSVYGEFDQDEGGNKHASIKAPEIESIQAEDMPNHEKLLERGIDYLKDCDEQASNQLSLAQHSDILGDDLLTQLGHLTHSAERTITYSDALVSHDGSYAGTPAFDQIIAQAIPHLLRQAVKEQLAGVTNSNQSDKSAQVAPTLTANQHALIEQKITRIQQLINDCLTRLERVAKQQYDTGSTTPESMQTLLSTLKSKQSQAQYLLDSGFFSL